MDGEKGQLKFTVRSPNGSRLYIIDCWKWFCIISIISNIFCLPFITQVLVVVIAVLVVSAVVVVVVVVEL